MDSDVFSGRHVLVTGGGSGIGRAAALALAQAGADCTLLGRRAEVLASTAADLVRFGRRARVVVGDVRDPSCLAEAVSAADGLAAPDLLVSSAGTNAPGPFEQTSLETMQAMVDVNVVGTMLTCQAFGAALLKAGRAGAIVCVSSQMGSVGFAGRAPYCATKHAVNGLTRALAVEWAPRGIRVNAVAPTFVETPLTAPMLDDPVFRSDVLSRIPQGRIAQVDEVVAAILFLLSDAASLITGHVLAVDGGWTAQ